MSLLVVFRLFIARQFQVIIFLFLSGKINDVLKNSHTIAKNDELPWITHIKSILQSHGLEHHHKNQSYRKLKHPSIHKLVHKNQCEKFHQNAFQKIINPENKLRTYALFKTQVGCEKYLHEIKNTKIRQSLTKFRLSNHCLNIEKGRHTVPKTPKEHRFCPFCPNKVEDEVHFLFDCPTYKVPRGEIITGMEKGNPAFLEHTQQEQFITFMNTDNVQLIAEFVHNLVEIRNFLTTKPKRLI